MISAKDYIGLRAIHIHKDYIGEIKGNEQLKLIENLTCPC